jgi:hypothetical protein
MIGRYRATPNKRFPAATVRGSPGRPFIIARKSAPVGNAVSPMPVSPPIAPMVPVPAPAAALGNLLDRRRSVSRGLGRRVVAQKRPLATSRAATTSGAEYNFEVVKRAWLKPAEKTGGIAFADDAAQNLWNLWMPIRPSLAQIADRSPGALWRNRAARLST